MIIHLIKNLSTKDVGSAFIELFFILIFSFMPFWLSLLLVWLSNESTIRQFTYSFLSSGDALLISAALVGPLIYVLFRSYGSLPNKFTIRFPLGWLYVSLIIIVCVIAAAVAGYNLGLSKILPENMAILSSFILILSFLILLSVSISRNYVENSAPSIMHTDTKNFLKDWDQS